MNDDNLPRRVRHSISLLWIAWGISAVALLINYFLFVPVVSGAIVGFIGLGLQALVIRFLSKGSNTARVFLMVVLVLAIPGLLLIGRLIAARSILSAAMTLVGFSLRVIAIYLLFTGESRPWFARQTSQEQHAKHEP